MQIAVFVKIVHILAVISAVGANATYQFWYGRAGQDKAQLLWVIDNVRLLDRRIANPSYIIAFLAGAATVVAGGYSFASLWVAASIVLFILVAILGAAVYAPAMRRQRALAEADPAAPEYQAAAKRSRAIGGVAMALVLLIAVMMIAKPTL